MGSATSRGQLGSEASLESHVRSGRGVERTREALPASGVLERASESTWKTREIAKGQLEGESSLAIKSGGV